MVKTAGRARLTSWQALGALALGAFAVEMGCGGKDDDADALPEEVQQAIVDLLVDAWGAVIDPALTEAHTTAENLVLANQAWADALAAGNDGLAEQENAQVAWVDAMTAWQATEVMQVGPSASSLTAVAGGDLRDEIYSWPTTNPCRVDQVTAKFEFEASDFFEESLVNVYGFDALETLLFSPANENDCPSQVSINQDGIWNDLGADGIAAARSVYAVRVSERIATDIEDIRAAWTGGFADDLASAGEAGSSFEGYLLGVNAIFDALFYLETQTKDRKLGWPLGLTDCGEEDCTGEIESLLAGRSHQWITANLVGFRSLFTGADGGGMDDLLDSVDHGDLATEMLEAMDAADAAAANVSTPLDAALTTDFDSVSALHDAVKEVTDLLKGDVATVLTLQIPSEAAGDSD